MGHGTWFAFLPASSRTTSSRHKGHAHSDVCCTVFLPGSGGKVSERARREAFPTHGLMGTTRTVMRIWGRHRSLRAETKNTLRALTHPSSQRPCEGELHTSNCNYCYHYPANQPDGLWRSWHALGIFFLNRDPGRLLGVHLSFLSFPYSF